MRRSAGLVSGRMCTGRGHPPSLAPLASRFPRALRHSLLPTQSGSIPPIPVSHPEISISVVQLEVPPGPAKSEWLFAGEGASWSAGPHCLPHLPPPIPWLLPGFLEPPAQFAVPGRWGWGTVSLNALGPGSHPRPPSPFPLQPSLQGSLTLGFLRHLVTVLSFQVLGNLRDWSGGREEISQEPQRQVLGPRPCLRLRDPLT